MSDTVTKLRYSGYLQVRHVCGHKQWHLRPEVAEEEALVAALAAGRCGACQRAAKEERDAGGGTTGTGNGAGDRGGV